MSDKYYYLDTDGETVCGPCSVVELRFKWGQKVIDANTLTCKEGSNDWNPLTASLAEERANASPIPFSREFLLEVRKSLADEVKAGRQKISQKNDASFGVPPVKQATSSDFGGVKSFLILLSVTVVVGLTSWAYNTWDMSQRATEQERVIIDNRNAILHAAQRAVSDKLRAPGSARFCSWEEVKPGMIGEKYADFGGWVDSQNGFGALLRSDWYVFMEKSDGVWRAKSVRVEERK